MTASAGRRLVLGDPTARLAVVTVCAVASFAAVAAANPPADPSNGGGFGDGGDSITREEAGFTTGGDAYASIKVSESALVTPGVGGSWSWPVNITVYGKPLLHIPTAAGGGVTPFDQYCFRVSYSTSRIEDVGELQIAANGGFELAQDRSYLEPAEAQHSSELEAFNDRIQLRTQIRDENKTIRDGNEVRADGAEPEEEQPVPPSLSKPVEPAFPLPLCPGTPGTVPDFVPAFKAAAAALKSVEAPVLYIPPGHGITGLEAYLTTGRQMTFTHDVKTFSQLGWDLTDDALAPTAISGTVEFEGSGTYVVDWADGAASEPQTAPGATYAEAQAGEASVTHSYIDTGTYPITITDTWRVKMVVSFLGETYTFIHEETLDPWGYPGGFQVTELRSRRDS
jgi:hypothetical protein